MAQASKGPSPGASSAPPHETAVRPKVPRVVEADFVAAAGPEGSLPAPTLPEIAFAGRSNVGKSTLMNALLGRKNLVRTSSTPGCTRSVNLFHARDDAGLELYLVDLPGYGYAKRSKHERKTWGPLLEKYLSERASLRAMVLLVDVRRGLEQEEDDLLDFVRHAKAARPPLSLIVAATKVDRLPSSQRKPALAKIARPGVAFFACSGETGDGVEALWKRVRSAALMEDPTPRGAPPETAPPPR